MGSTGSEDRGTESFNVTPPDFDVTSASPEELARYGIPPRPDPTNDPDGYARWSRQFPKGFRLIEPQLRERPELQHRPLSAIDEAAGTAYNWSGAIVNPPSGKTFSQVTGMWWVPPIWAPGKGTFRMSTWIGIDGDGSSDVLQAGVEADVTEPDGTPAYSMWYQWYPGSNTQITNLSVTDRDLVSVTITATSTSTATALISVGSTGVSINIQAPAGWTLQGNCAEWIVERPQVNGVDAILANYGSVIFGAVGAWDGAEWTYLDSSTLNLLSMVEGSSVVSVPAVLDSRDLVVSFNELDIAFIANDSSNRILRSELNPGGSWITSVQDGAESSPSAPSYTVFPNNYVPEGRWLAFKSNDRSNRLMITSSIDGTTWPASVQIGSESTKAGPSLAAFNRQLWVAFIANDSSNRILYSTTGNASSWSASQQAGTESSPAAPSLAVFGGKLWLAFKSNDSAHRLLVTSSPDGHTWPASVQIGSESTKAGPSLAVFGGVLFVAFIADDSSNRILICASQDGVQWTPSFQAGGESSPDTPSLAMFGGQLWLAFKANDSSNRLMITSSADAVNWPSSVQIGSETTKAAPSLLAPVALQ